MVDRSDMLEALDVLGPDDVVRVLRAGDHEAELREAPCRLNQQPLQHRLPVGAIGTEIGQVPALRPFQRGIRRGIDRAVQRPCRRGAIAPLNEVERRATREGEIEVVAADQLRGDVLGLPSGELRERDRRVDIVEGRDLAGPVLDTPAYRDPVRNVGTDDYGVGGGDQILVRFELTQFVVENETAPLGIGQIAVRARIPGNVALQECHGVSTGRQGLQERPVRGCVTVAPGGREAEAENDDLHLASCHAALRSRLADITSRSSRSSSAPRRS
jgi:hypothetical protein